MGEIMSENCASGENCGIHFRKDVREFDEVGLILATDYVGDKLIITRLNPLMVGISSILLAQQGRHADLYITLVYGLGSDAASFSESVDLVSADEATLFVETHGSIMDEEHPHNGALKFHEGIVEAFKAGGLSLDVPLTQEQAYDIITKSIHTV